MLTDISPSGMPSNSSFMSSTLSISTPQNYAPLINLSWTAVPNATAYNLLRSSQSGTEATYVTINAPATSYADLGVVFQGVYFYVIQAVVGAQTSARSNEVSGTPTSLPPRTEKKGSGKEHCGMSSTGLSAAAAVAAVAATLLLLCVRRPRRRV